MSKHYGNLDVYGYVTIGKNTTGSYRFPLVVGENGEFIGLEDGEVVFKRPGPSIFINEISGAGSVLNDIDNLTEMVNEISGNPPSITDDIFVDLTVGAIDAGNTVVEGTTLQEFAEKLLKTTFFPTFTAPTFSLSRSGSSQYEIGEILNITLTSNFDRGSIDGDLVGGVWNPSLVQDFRAGAASLYTINGTPNGTTPSLVVNNYQIVSGNQNWSASVDYNQGPQPKDSKGDDYSSPLPAGSLAANSSNISGTRRSFWGTVENTTVFSSSAEVRALTSSQLGLSNGSTFTINIPVGAEQVVFAYPATLNEVDSVKHVEGLNAEVKGTFTELTISVDSSNGYDSINYRVYYYMPVEPFADVATYTVTI